MADLARYKFSIEAPPPPSENAGEGLDESALDAGGSSGGLDGDNPYWLPTELWHMIVRLVPDDDLYFLAAACRMFRDIVAGVGRRLRTDWSACCATPARLRWGVASGALRWIPADRQYVAGCRRGNVDVCHKLSDQLKGVRATRVYATAFVEAAKRGHVDALCSIVASALLAGTPVELSALQKALQEAAGHGHLPACEFITRPSTNVPPPPSLPKPVLRMRPRRVTTAIPDEPDSAEPEQISQTAHCKALLRAAENGHQHVGLWLMRRMVANFGAEGLMDTPDLHVARALFHMSRCRDMWADYVAAAATVNSDWLIAGAAVAGRFGGKPQPLDPEVMQIALKEAACVGNTTAIRWLAGCARKYNKRKDPTATPVGLDPRMLRLAAKGGHTEACWVLLHAIRRWQISAVNAALVSAAKKGHSEVCRLLLGGKNKWFVNRPGIFLAATAAAQISPATAPSISSAASVEICQQLLAYVVPNPADIDFHDYPNDAIVLMNGVRGDYGWSAALRAGNRDYHSYLVNMGGRTILTDTAVADLLLAAADHLGPPLGTWARNSERTSPCQWVVEDFDMAAEQYAETSRAAALRAAAAGNLAALAFLHRHFDLDTRSDAGDWEALLCAAARIGRLDIIEWIEVSFAPSVPNVETVLDAVIRGGSPDVCAWFDRVSPAWIDANAAQDDPPDEDVFDYYFGVEYVAVANIFRPLRAHADTVLRAAGAALKNRRPQSVHWLRQRFGVPRAAIERYVDGSESSLLDLVYSN